MIFTINQVLDSAGLEKYAIDEIVLVGGSFKIPYFRTLVSNYFNKQIDKVSLKINNQTFLLYEDIAVSLGASAYGYFNSRSDNIVLIEKLPLSIGIESADGQIIKIIERNTPIPITKTKSFTTEDPTEKSVDITVFQGESIFKDKCVFIGKFSLLNLPPNKPVIFVSIRVDSNGIITVSARDKRGFTESGIQIETSSLKLSEQIITDLLAKYEQTKGSEIQYKNIISNYYQLITLIDKISYQINFINLKLEPEIIKTIRLDLEKVLGAMSNPYIISRYRINTNLLKKCAIINDISSGLVTCDSTFEMSLEEISNYIDMLIKLREYLTDRYDIFIIQDTNDVLAQGQTKKLETFDDKNSNQIQVQTDDIDTAANYFQVFDFPNTKKTSCSSIKDLNNLQPIDLSENKTQEKEQIYTKIDYDNLVDYLRSNIKDFELTEFGEKYLLEKINQITLDIDNTDTIIYENLINLINELCEYTKTNFSD